MRREALYIFLIGAAVVALMWVLYMQHPHL